MGRESKSGGYPRCLKIKIGLVLEFRGSTFHHCCSFEVATGVSSCPQKSQKNMTPFPQIVQSRALIDEEMGVPMQSPQRSAVLGRIGLSRLGSSIVCKP